MEKLLRNCYTEAGIKGANAVVFQKRSNVIRTIVDESLLEEDEWKGLTEWLLGKKSNEVEDILIKLEENFCEEDDNFSKENIKAEHAKIPGLWELIKINMNIKDRM